MAGPWEKYGAQPQQGNVFALPPTPEEVERAKRSAEAQEIQRQRMEADIAAREEANRLAREKFEYEKSVKGATGAGQFPKITAKVRQDALDAYNDADALERIASDLESQFDATIGKTKGISGFQDYLPTGTNKRFDDTSFQARGYVKSALGFTGGEGNTIGEIGLNYGPYLPEAGDRDEQIVGKIAALRSLAADARKKSVATLGGVPDANGTVTPGQADERPNAMTATRTVGGDPLQAAAFGATTGVDQYPPEMIQAHEALVGRLLMQGGGKLDPQVYAAERAKLNQQFQFSGDTQSDIVWAQGINDYLGKGGKSVPTDIKPPERKLTPGEFLHHSAVNNPVGAAAVGFTDMVGMGGVSALTGDDVRALGDQGGWTGAGLTLGQIAGSVYGAGNAGKLAGWATGKVLPSQVSARLLQGGGRLGNFGREMGADALYSGAIGTAQGEDPLTAAAFGAGGSLAGRVAGKVGGGIAGGVAESAPVQALKARGIPMTVGQRLGGFAKSVEDKATSIPLVGDIINARRLEGLQAFNRAAFDDAGRPIGFTPKDIGKEGVSELFQEAGNAYDNATAGVRVPLDPQLAQDFSHITAAGHRLPDDLRNRFGLALENRVGPVLDAGELTGDTYQQAVRGLKSYKAENVKPGFEQDYRDGLSGAINALKGQMQRGGGQSVVDGLGKADDAYRNIKIIEDATQRAKGGSASGELYTFTPSQLQGAVAKSAKKYPGQTPLTGLADDAQGVLPSQVPDSGTAGRLANMAMGSGTIGAGAGIGALFGGGEGAQDGALYSALMTGALLAGGTKGGQKALGKMIFDRPQALKTTGAFLNTRKGLFGRAMIPLVLPDSYQP